MPPVGIGATVAVKFTEVLPIQTALASGVVVVAIVASARPKLLKVVKSVAFV